MRGHIRKRGNTWCVVVDAGRDPETRRRRQRWHSGFKTRKDAQRALADILTRLDRGTYVEPTQQTLGEFLDEWLAATRHRVRASTFESYARNIRVHAKPRLGSTKLQHLTPAALNRFYAELLSEGRTNGKGGLSPRTVRYIHTILRKSLADAVRWNKTNHNVADNADPPSQRASKPRIMNTWTADELRAFLEHVESDRL